MTRLRLTYCFALACLLGMPAMHAQTVHPSGLQQMMAVAEDELAGTARFIGMAGAMTAVGGDPSAVKRNPAGLGIYRHSQFSVSGDGTFRRFMQSESALRTPLYNRWHLSQASYVFALTHPERVAGIVSNNIMISYAKRADIQRIFTLNSYSESALPGQDWIETKVDEYVYRHDADIHFAQNISNRFYWGVGMTLEWVQARQTISRWEYMSVDHRGLRQEYDLQETTIGKAVGWGASAGVLVHPVQAIRIGLSFESPLIGRMRQTDYFTEKITYPDDPGRNAAYDSPDYSSSWLMVTPLKASAGVGLQWKNHGLLSLQYDMQYHKLTGFAHTPRVGLEAAFTNHWFLEAGYAYTTFYSRHRVSAGLHYIGKWLRIGLAYSHSWSTGSVIDALYYTEQGVYKIKENKLVLTFQWNS